MSIVDRAPEFRRNIEEEPIVHFHKVSLAKLRALEELPEEIPSEESVKSAVRSMVLDKLDHLAIMRIGRALKYDANTDNPLNGIEDDLKRWKESLYYHKKQGTSKGRAQTDGTHFSAEEIRNFVERDEETLTKESELVAVHKNYYLSDFPILAETSPYSSHAHDITAAYNLILPD